LGPQPQVRGPFPFQRSLHSVRSAYNIGGVESEEIEGRQPCKLCKGSGRNPTRYTVQGPDECPRCGGTGEEPAEPDNRFRGGGPHQKGPS